MATPSTRALVAHVLRRMTFGPYPGQVDTWAKQGVSATIAHFLNAPALPVADSATAAGADDGSDVPVQWWLKRIGNPAGGVHEKMTFFWHGHLTTGHDKVYRWKLEVPQNLLLRRYALGNFRTLLQRITVDGAMLNYLDGNYSSYRFVNQGEESIPNENFAREVMELFSLGRGTVTHPNYTQADVENGAKGLSGWYVDYDTGKVWFDAYGNDLWRYRYNTDPVKFLGKDVRIANDVVNAVVDHPACAPWVAGRIWRWLVGADPSNAKRAALGKAFKAASFEVKPVVTSIVHDPAFLANRNNRPKMPVEWVTQGMAALGLTDAAPHETLRLDTLNALGQVPFYPPNVSGWPWGNRWLGPGIALARAGFAVDASSIKAVADSTNPVATTLARCSLYEVGAETSAALKYAADQLAGKAPGIAANRATVLMGLAVGSPEFALA